MNRKLILASCLTSLMLSACDSGGSSSKDSDTFLTTDTATLKLNAVNSLGGNIDGNANAVSAIANRNSEVLVGTLGDVTVGGTEQIPQPIEADTVQVQDSIQSMFASSLATAESNNSTTTRTGNTINIDPDEVELCSDAMLFGNATLEERNQCEQLMKQVTVELQATTADTGTVTYRFMDEDVLTFGYGETTEYSELDIGGLQTVVEAIYLVSDSLELQSLPQTMSGSFRFSATSTNKMVGSEAGSIAYDIIKPIRISGSNKEGDYELKLDAGNMFTIAADAAAGTGSLSFDAGALSMMAGTDSGIARFNLAGWTGKADINTISNELVVRDLGLSKGPMSVSINNTEVMKMTLDAFGFNVTEGTDMEPGEIIIDGNMDLSLLLNNHSELEIDPDLASVMYSIMIPGGTRISRTGNGSTKVAGVGPLSVSYSVIDTSNVEETETLVVNSGECFNSLPGAGDGTDSDSLFSGESATEPQGPSVANCD